MLSVAFSALMVSAGHLKWMPLPLMLEKISKCLFGAIQRPQAELNLKISLKWLLTVHATF